MKIKEGNKKKETKRRKQKNENKKRGLRGAREAPRWLIFEQNFKRT